MKKLLQVACLLACGLGVTWAGVGTNTIVDVLDGSDGWLEFNNAQFVGSAGVLSPTAGTELMYHTVSANWSGSAVYKDFDFFVQEGLYIVTLDVGDDGNVDRPFVDVADGRVEIGFFDAATTIGGHADVKNAITAFAGLDGVTKKTILEPIPSAGWETWQYTYRVDAGSPVIGSEAFLAIQAQSAGAGGVQASFDNIKVTYVPNGLSVGADLVATSVTSNFHEKAVQAYPFRDDLGFTSDMEIGISGTMTLSAGADYALNQFNDQLGFAFASTDKTWLNESAGSQDVTWSLYAASTVAWPGPNESMGIYQEGVGSRLLAYEVAATNHAIDYAINLTFPTNFNTGVNGDGFVYEFEFGFDYDRDGNFDFVTNGTFNAFEYDRTHFGFVVRKNGNSPETALTNTYSYVIQSGHIGIFLPVTEIGNIAVEMDGANAIVCWEGGEGATYTLQHRTDLVLDGWSNVVDGIIGYAGTICVTNAAADSTAFYRVIIE